MQSEALVDNYNPEQPPKGNKVVWYTFPHIEVPFFMIKSLIQKWTGKLDTNTPFVKLKMELEDILKNEQGIVFCEEP